MDLNTPIRQAGFAFKIQSRKLERLQIFTIGDLLFHVPFRYEDNSLVSDINLAQPGETLSVQGTVVATKYIPTRGRISIQKVTINDGTGDIDCTFFNQIYILKTIKKGNLLSVSGRVDQFGSKKGIIVKEYEVLASEDEETTHTKRLVPVYPETHGLSSKWMRNRIKGVLKEIKLDDYLPSEIKNKEKLMDLDTAIRSIHFPDTLNQADEARERLAFDELLTAQLRSKVRKIAWEEEKTTLPFEFEPYKKSIESFWEGLPFELTGAQRRALDEIISDLGKTIPMNRLLEGDVGSGKTVVAAIAMYLAYLNGFQSALMAPTEILAIQHFKTISSLLEPFGVKVDLRTSSVKGKGENTDILVGTHALLQKGTNFETLGLIVIDEQQRFGVEQRAILRKKGTNPHVLTMTATPIPRTVLLTLYGDLKVSFLDEMPKGRKVIKTWLVPEEKRDGAYKWLKKQIKEEGAQIFIVCPFIEESESLNTVKAAKVEYERLKQEVFSDFKLGLLHGKLKSSEKDEVLKGFKDKNFDILVSTPVVEVGIDIPDATVMMVEAAERFGLAQLHQMRGRVGRSDKDSYCLLFTDSNNENARNRLKNLEKMHSGPELAELDLRLRGPGDMFGTMQHGIAELKVANFSNFPLIEKTRLEADNIITNLNKYPSLKQKVEELKHEKEISPD